MASEALKVRRPCTECPWVVATPPGQFPVSRYARLRSTTGTPGNEAPLGAPMFACHKSPGGGEFVCAGWLASVGYLNLTARMNASAGLFSGRAFSPGRDWPALHETYEAMGAAMTAGIPFYSDCVNWPPGTLPVLSHLVDNGREVSRETFRRRVRPAVLTADAPWNEPGLRPPGTYGTFYFGLRGHPIYWYTNSMIEYVYANYAVIEELAKKLRARRVCA